MSEQPEAFKIVPTEETRLGRMLSAGRVTATMKSLKSQQHITLTLKCSANVDGKWVHVPYALATHVFITQGDGSWGSNKIGTYYTRSGKLVYKTADQAWRFAAKHTLIAAHTGEQFTGTFELRESDLCGRCGKQLTDPISIARGLGPTCYDEETGSQHYHKQQPEPRPQPAPEVAVDRKGRNVPRTFEALASAVKR